LKDVISRLYHTAVKEDRDVKTFLKSKKPIPKHVASTEPRKSRDRIFGP